MHGSACVPVLGHMPRMRAAISTVALRVDCSSAPSGRHDAARVLRDEALHQSRGFQDASDWHPPSSKSACADNSQLSPVGLLEAGLSQSLLGGIADRVGALEPRARGALVSRLCPLVQYRPRRPDVKVGTMPGAVGVLPASRSERPQQMPRRARVRTNDQVQFQQWRRG